MPAVVQRPLMQPQVVQRPPATQPGSGRSGTEPAALWTIVVLILVAVAFVVLLAVVFSL
jgi:hypothetical protein